MTERLNSVLLSVSLMCAGVTTSVPVAAQVADSARTEDSSLNFVVDPETYIVGAGDRLSIFVWGQANVHFEVTVNVEGTIVVPTCGDIHVGDYLLSDAKVKIIEEMRRFYNHDAAISVHLVRLRTMSVEMAGMLRSNGRVWVSSVDRVSHAIEKSGGLVAGASARNIEIRRVNGDVQRVDLVRRNQTGHLESDPVLGHGDIVFVPPARAWIQIDGAVQMPGRYEYVPGETISDVIKLVGGLCLDADSGMVELVRFEHDTGKGLIDYEIDLSSILRDPESSFCNFRLLPDDRLYVRRKYDFHPAASVSITGEVRFPGNYPIVERKTTLKDVIDLAGGFTESAATRRLKLVRDITQETRIWNLYVCRRCSQRI